MIPVYKEFTTGCVKKKKKEKCTSAGRNIEILLELLDLSAIIIKNFLKCTLLENFKKCTLLEQKMGFKNSTLTQSLNLEP